jgi:sugar lactone lactonase YvrE
VPAEQAVVAFDSRGVARALAHGLRGDRILVNGAGELYVCEPGVHAEEPSRIWLLGPDGGKSLLDPGLPPASGIAFSPDGGLFFAAERSAARVDSFVVPSAGTLADREPFYWLHAGDPQGDAGTGDLAVDAQGSLYAATPMGVQVCDRNGRVRAILWLPSPSGPVTGLCWGGGSFDLLYATDGRALYRRHLRVAGHPQWSAPAALPKASAG